MLYIERPAIKGYSGSTQTGFKIRNKLKEGRARQNGSGKYLCNVEGCLSSKIQHCPG